VSNGIQSADICFPILNTICRLDSSFVIPGPNACAVYFPYFSAAAVPSVSVMTVLAMLILVVMLMHPIIL
jgi:hypothetical protein